MQSFKRILVVIEHDKVNKSNSAVQRGVELAKKDNASLTLMTVIPHPKKLVADLAGVISEEELIDKFKNMRESELSALADTFRDEIAVQTVTSVGREFIETIRQVVLGDHDLLIKMARVEETGFDSSDFHLMRKCPQPVWLVKSRKTKPKKLLAAIDLSLEKEQEGKQLNARIMDLSLSLASAYSADIEILSCWSIYGESSLRSGGFFRFSDEQMNDLINKEEQANLQKQNDFIARYTDTNIIGHVRKGDPTIVIPEFVNSNEVDILVMGTVARTGIPGLLIGNTSETILNKMSTSVLTLKPVDFQSIVT